MAFGKGHHLHLIDGSAYIFRAFHALPPLTRKSDGLPTGAVRGFCDMLDRYIMGNTGRDAATHVAVVFDKGSITFRNEIYDQYKANRSEMPDDLRPQIPITRDASRAFNLATLEIEGFEADDIIAALSCRARDAGGRVTILSSRQGSDAAGRRRGRDARPDEEQAHRPRRRASRSSAWAPTAWSTCRRWRATRGQRAGRAGHRHQDGRAAHQRIRRPGDAPGPGRGDQAAQAPSDAHRPPRRRSNCRSGWSQLDCDMEVGVTLDSLELREAGAGRADRPSSTLWSSGP